MYQADFNVTLGNDVYSQSLNYSPVAWKKAVRLAMRERDARLGKDRCMIDPSLSTSHLDPEEHVIPQGVGIKWIKLPKGATAKHTNNRASSWERCLLRYGLMGALRPFFVKSKKSAAFEIGDGKRIVFSNDHLRGFQIETHGIRRLQRHGQGPGQIRFRVPLHEGPTLDVSRALNKIVYLSMCVMNPAFAFSASLSDLRRYLSDDEPTYRPYGERFVAGAAPVAGIGIDLLGSKSASGRIEGDHGIAKVRLHHVEYFVPLFPDHHVVPGPRTGIRWFPHSAPATDVVADIAFQFDSIELNLPGG